MECLVLAVVAAASALVTAILARDQLVDAKLKAEAGLSDLIGKNSRCLPNRLHQPAPWLIRNVRQKFMRPKLIICILVLSAVITGVHGEKARDESAAYRKDLGMMKTPWGVLHSFDLMKAVERVRPQYPIQERRDGISGGVLLAVLVTEDGLVADAKVFKSSGNRNFEEAAIRAVRQWKYRPLDPRERFVTTQPISFTIDN